jgi:taurine dioxygenase
MRTSTVMQFERVTGTIGAMVRGIDLEQPLQDVEVSGLRNALHEHGVLFFQFNRSLDAADFLSCARWFGEPEEKYALTTSAGSAPFIDSAVTPMQEFRVNAWHTDGSALTYPPQCGLMTPIELPETGGDTMWASMYAAWDALSPHYQALLAGLSVRHGTSRLPFLQQGISAVHPAVIRDPVTGRRMLYVNSNYSEEILELSERESDTLLQMLFEHVNTPEFHVRLRWRPGLVAVWDERTTQHRGIADFSGPRKLRRLTLPGDRPTA